MSLIALEEQDQRLGELTEIRPISSLPVAGRYRLVDFVLSNMVNSGIVNVGVLLPERSRSYFDHLRSGKDWNLARHHKGLFYLPPYVSGYAERTGDLRNIYFNLQFPENSTESYILFARSDAIYNMDFSAVLDYHKSVGADITMIVNRAPKEEYRTSIPVKMDEKGFVTDISMRAAVYKGELEALGVYLMDTHLFISLVRSSFEHGGHDWNDVLLRAIDLRYKIFAYEHKGFVRRISSVASYFEASMDLMRPEVRKEIFESELQIHTKVKDSPPVRYGKTAVVKNCLLANGCEIYGEVENSILFRGVRVAEGAVIKNSIIMQDGSIESRVQLDCAICDKNVVVRAGKMLRGAPTYPIYIAKGKIV